MVKKRNYNFFLAASSLLLFIITLEAGARLVLYFTRGSSTIGMPERTLYLNYQPFVMFGPDWDAKTAEYNNQLRRIPDALHNYYLLNVLRNKCFPLNSPSLKRYLPFTNIPCLTI